MRSLRSIDRRVVLPAVAALLVACGAPSESGDAPAAGGEDDGGSETEGSEEGGEGGDTIRVAYLETGSSAPMFLTADVYAEEVGLDLEMTRVSSGNEAITGVATGQFDIGFAGIGSGAYNAHAEGLPVSFVAPMHAGYLEDYFILSSTIASDREDAASVAEDMSDLAGETFAVNGPGVVTEALLGQALDTPARPWA